MNVRLFDIVNDEVELCPNVLLIPEFEALYNHYKKPFALKILAGLHYLLWPHKEENPYYNIPELIKPDVIYDDFFKDRVKDMTEPNFVAAKDKMTSFYDSTILRFHVTHKGMIEKMSELQSKDFKTWPENMAQIQKQAEKAGTFMEQFVKSQNAAVEDMGRTKGELDEGYDEGKSYTGGL